MGKMKMGSTLLAGLVLGYAGALLAFRQDTRIDLNSGRVRTTSVLFPFSIQTDHKDRAFEVLFPVPSGDKTEWALAERRRFIPLMHLDLITEGYEVLRAENRLVQILTTTDLGISERRAYAAAFMDKLHKEGATGVSTYATSLWERHMLEQSAPGKQ